MSNEQNGHTVEARIGRKRNDIQVLRRSARNELLGLDLFEASNLIAVAGGMFVVFFLGRLFHAFDQCIDHTAIFSLEKQQCRVDVLSVAVFIDIADAGRRAAANLVLQAGSGAVLEVAVLALTDEKKFL